MSSDFLCCSRKKDPFPNLGSGSYRTMYYINRTAIKKYLIHRYRAFTPVAAGFLLIIISKDRTLLQTRRAAADTPHHPGSQFRCRQHRQGHFLADRIALQTSNGSADRLHH